MTCEKFVFKRRTFQYLAAVTGALATVSSGINSSWTSPFITYLTSNSSIIPMTSDEAGWCAVSPALGCILGSSIAACLVDRIGRKNTVLLMAPLVFFSQIGIGLVRNVWYLCLLRLFIGAADGAYFTALPMYVGEIASPDIKGFLSSLISLFFTLGVLLINIIGCFFSISTCSIICACVPAIHFLGFVFMPESPYYYIKVKKFQQAERSLKMFTCSANVDEQLELLSDAVRVQEDMIKNTKFTDLFTVPSIRKATLIFIVIGMSLKACAKAPVLSYTKMIFEESGSNISPTISAIAYCTVELVVMLVTTHFIMDRFGKKFLIVISLAGCSIALLLMGLYFYIKDFHSDLIGHLNWLPISALISYSILIGMGLSFSKVSYLSELFPTNVKANALSFAEIFTVLSSAVTTKVFQMMNDGFKTLCVSFVFFSVFSMIMLVFVVKYVPETKGQTLEEVQSMFSDKKLIERNNIAESKKLKDNEVI